jgi:hypothetical protein
MFEKCHIATARSIEHVSEDNIQRKKGLGMTQEFFNYLFYLAV